MRTYALTSNPTLSGYDIVETLTERDGTQTSIVILTCYDIERVDGLIDHFKAEDLRILEDEQDGVFEDVTHVDDPSDGPAVG